MYHRPEDLQNYTSQLIEKPYLRQSFSNRELRLSELANYGEMIGSMLVAVAIDRTQEGAEVSQESLAKIRHLTHLVGSMDDTSSNRLLETIFGPAFSSYTSQQKRMMGMLTNGYDMSVPREATEEEMRKAVAIDAAIVARGRAYLLSRQAQTTIWQQEIPEKGGCPLVHTPKTGRSDFGAFIDIQIQQCRDTGLYMGPVQFFLQTITSIPQDVREYVISHHGQVVDWNLSIEAA